MFHPVFCTRLQCIHNASGYMYRSRSIFARFHLPPVVTLHSSRAYHPCSLSPFFRLPVSTKYTNLLCSSCWTRSSNVNLSPSLSSCVYVGMSKFIVRRPLPQKYYDYRVNEHDRAVYFNSGPSRYTEIRTVNVFTCIWYLY